ncbi:MAG TPA: hypothetical protein VII35_16015 [Steroidobacteraceae bacterium]
MGTATAKSAISRTRKSTAKRARGKLAPRRSARGLDAAEADSVSNADLAWVAVGAGGPD